MKLRKRLDRNLGMFVPFVHCGNIYILLYFIYSKLMSTITIGFGRCHHERGHQQKAQGRPQWRECAPGMQSNPPSHPYQHNFGLDSAIFHSRRTWDILCRLNKELFEAGMIWEWRLHDLKQNSSWGRMMGRDPSSSSLLWMFLAYAMLTRTILSVYLWPTRKANLPD